MNVNSLLAEAHNVWDDQYRWVDGTEKFQVWRYPNLWLQTLRAYCLGISNSNPKSPSTPMSFKVTPPSPPLCDLPHPHSSPPPPTREHSIFLPVNIKQTKKGHEHNTKAQGQKLRAHTWNTQGHKLQDKERVLPMHIKHVHIGHNHKEHTQQQELGSHTCTGTNLEKTL